MLRNSFILILLLNISLFSKSTFIDFGIHGLLYDIEEINGDDLIKKELKKIDAKKIIIKLNKEISNSFISHLNLPSSIKDMSMTKIDIVKARWDIKDSRGSLIKAKGDDIISRLPKGVKLELCFIDANVPKAVFKKILQKFGKCIYMVNNINSEEFTKLYGHEAYPLVSQNLTYIDRFKIKYFPTKIIKYEDKINTITLSIPNIIEDLKYEN